MLLIILFGLTAILSSVYGDCVVGNQIMNANWTGLSGDWFYYYRTSSSPVCSFKCIKQTYGTYGRHNMSITTQAEIRTGSPFTIDGYATNQRRTSWEEIFPDNKCFNARVYPIAFEQESYFIFQYCYSESNETAVYVAVRDIIDSFHSETQKEIERKMKEINTAHKFEKFEHLGCE